MPDPQRPDPQRPDRGKNRPGKPEPRGPEPGQEPDQAAPRSEPGEPGEVSDAGSAPGEEGDQEQRSEEPGDSGHEDSRNPFEDTVEMAAIRWDDNADDEGGTPDEHPDEPVGASAGEPETDEPETDEPETDEPETDEPTDDDRAAHEPSDSERGPAAGRTPPTSPRDQSVAEPATRTEPGTGIREDVADDEPAVLADEPAVAARTSTPARDRLVRALLRPSRRQVVVAVLLGLLGFAAVTQVRANELDDSYAGLRQQDLIDTLNNLSNAERRADAEIARLQQDKEELENSTNRREAAIAQAKQLTDTLDILAGVVPVTGPGLRITIEETDQEIDIDTMIDTVQELRNAGAESMEFNDEVRVVAQTSLQQGVGGIQIDGTLLEPPYVIDVIGDPDTLESSGMRFPTGPLEQLGDDLATTTIDRSGDIEISSVVEVRKPEHLEPE